VVERLGNSFVGDHQEEEAMTPTLTPPETVAFPGADERCDRCNAAAKLRVMIAGGGELVFCGHHANKYAEKLVKIAVQVAVSPEFDWRGTELMATG
jgi:hypothetical protein